MFELGVLEEMAPFLGVILLVLLGWWVVQKRRPDSVQELLVQLQDAREVAEVAVAGVQQLYETGQIDDMDRYGQVEAYLLDLFPGLTGAQLEMIIEGSVYLVKQGAQWAPRALRAKTDLPVSAE